MAARFAAEREVLHAIGGRLPVTIPSPVAHDDHVCLRTKVIGASGFAHHQRAMTDPAVAATFAIELGSSFAAVHTVLSAAERARRASAHGAQSARRARGRSARSTTPADRAIR
jgi:hypothetical protein